MRIRNRLTIWFSLLAFGIFSVFSCTVYFFSSQYRKSEFNNRLKNRVEITEKIFLESENSPGFRAAQEQFLNKLPMETEEVVEHLEKTSRTAIHLSFSRTFWQIRKHTLNSISARELEGYFMLTARTISCSLPRLTMLASG
jgi:hypothetical protein